MTSLVATPTYLPSFVHSHIWGMDRTTLAHHGLWVMKTPANDSTSPNIIYYYDFKEGKQVFPVVEYNNYFRWIDRKTDIVSNDMKCFKSFPDGKSLFELKEKAASHVDYNNLHVFFCGRDRYGDAPDTRHTIFMDEKFNIVYKTEGHSQLIKPAYFVNKLANRNEIIDSTTYKIIYKTTEIAHWLDSIGFADTFLEPNNNTIVTISKPKPEHECAICHENVDKKECTFTCGHTNFHFNCVSKTKICPSCTKEKGEGCEGSTSTAPSSNILIKLL